MSTRRSRLTGHTAWTTPLLFAVCAWGVVIWVAEYDTAHPEAHAAKDDLIAIAGAAALALTVVGLVLAVRNVRRTRAAIQQERHDALARQRYESECSAGWRAAQALAAQLLAGQRPEPLTVWGLVLHRGETAYLDVTAEYSRLLPTQSGYEAWTDPRPVRIIATDQGLHCDMPRWTSIWYGDITGFYPELDRWHVTLDIEGARPVRLDGPITPVMAVYLAAVLHGHTQLHRHPGIAKIVPSWRWDSAAPE